jgi:DNA-binding CsgD family transcriptional regulator
LVRRALDHGAAGYLPKSSGLDELRDAIRTVLACEQWLPAMLRGAVARAQSSTHDAHLAARLASLSPQQFRVLVLVAEGLLNKQIADRLDVQERTVKAHLSAIFDRLGVRNRTQAGVVLRELERREWCCASSSSAIRRGRSSDLGGSKPATTALHASVRSRTASPATPAHDPAPTSAQAASVASSAAAIPLRARRAARLRCDPR